MCVGHLWPQASALLSPVHRLSWHEHCNWCPCLQAPADATEVLLAVAANANANFTASFVLPAAATPASSGALCIADGDQMVVYAVAQDKEGTWPGRWPNNSTVIRAM